MQGLAIRDIHEQIVTNITISMNVTGNDIVYKTINSNFIGADIARTDKIPTKTSQLTNDSNFVTSTALTGYATETYVSEQLATKQDKLDSYSDSASVANDKLTINYKVKQEDGTYSNVPVEFTASAEPPSNMVTTDTDQNITSFKTFINNDGQYD